MEGRISASSLCEIVGLSRQLHAQWIQRGLLEPTGVKGITEVHATALTILHRLASLLGSDESRLAWESLRGKPDHRSPEGRLEIVYDCQYKSANYARDDAELIGLVLHGRPVRVVVVGQEISNVLDAVRRVEALL